MAGDSALIRGLVGVCAVIDKLQDLCMNCLLAPPTTLQVASGFKHGKAQAAKARTNLATIYAVGVESGQPWWSIHGVVRSARDDSSF